MRTLLVIVVSVTIWFLLSFPETVSGQDAARLYERGLKKMAKNDNEAAISDFQEVLNKAPTQYPDVYLYKSKLELRLNRYESVYKTLKYFGIYVTDDDDLRGMLFALRGFSGLNLGQVENAINDFESALGLEYKDGTVYASLADAQMVLKNKIHNKSVVENALENYSKAIAICKDSVQMLGELYYKRAKARYSLQYFGQALADINKSVAIFSNNPSMRELRAKIESKRGLYRDALSDYNQVVNSGIYNAGTLLERGKLFFRINRYQAGMSDFKTVTSMDKGDFGNQALFYTGKGEQVISHYSELLKKTSDNDSLRIYAGSLALFYALNYDAALSGHYLKMASAHGSDLNELLLNDEYSNVRFKKEFTDSLKIIPPAVSDEFLNQLAEKEMMEKSPGKLTATVNFSEPSGNGLLDGHETGNLILNITNNGNGIIKTVDIGLAENNNVPGIAYQVTKELEFILPGESREISFRVHAANEIGKSILDFTFTINCLPSFVTTPLNIKISTTPFVSVQTALLYPDSLRSLDLSGRGLKKLPAEIAAFKNLEYLNLNDNKIQRIDTIITGFKKLKQLYISGNQLDSLPERTGRLLNLEILVADSNKITILPKSLANLPRLRVFSLRSNNIKDLSESLFSCRNLEYLDFSSNRIEKIPDAISNLANLVSLNIHDNQVSVIPATLGSLNNLRLLDISGMKKSLTEQLPEFLLNMKPFIALTYTDWHSGDQKTFSFPSGAVYAGFQKWRTAILENNYRACIQMGDYLQKAGHFEMADHICNRLLSAKNLECPVYMMLGSFFDERGLNALADSMYMKTLAFGNPGHVQRMKMADELFQHKRFDIAEVHYNRVVHDLSITNDTTIYELAKFFEGRAMYRFAIEMYRKIVDNPLYRGTGKSLLASLAVADLCLRQPEQETKPAYELYRAIAYTTPADSKATLIVSEACRKCWTLLDKDVKNLSRKFELNKQKLVRLANQQAAAENTGSFGSFLSNLSSQYAPGIGSAIAGTATKIGSDIYARNRSNNYENLNRINQQIDREISDKKRVQGELTDRINTLSHGQVAQTPDPLQKTPAPVSPATTISQNTRVPEPVPDPDISWTRAEDPYKVLDAYFSTHPDRTELNDSTPESAVMDFYSPVGENSKLKYTTTRHSAMSGNEYSHIFIISPEKKTYNDRVYHRHYSVFNKPEMQKHQNDNEYWSYCDKFVASSLIINKNGTKVTTNPVPHYKTGDLTRDTSATEQYSTTSSHLVLSTDSTVTTGNRMFKHVLVIKTVSTTTYKARDMQKFNFIDITVTLYAKYIGLISYRATVTPVIESEAAAHLHSTTEMVLTNYDIRK
ncbi:MAG: leucine-rich repeat domain-containing protein [Bacteroidota bacterium]